MSNRLQRIRRSGAPALIRAAAAAALIAGISGVQAQAAGDRAGYLTTGDARPVTDASGECWHTGEWTRGMYYRRCDARPVKAGQAVPPPVAAQAPAKTEAPESPRLAAKPSSFKLSLDTLFDFDRSALKPRGRALLDTLADRIGRADYRSIEIVGHADRIGSAGYNQLLSERRAQAVREYLAARGVDARKITAEGVGSSEPVTATEQCRGLGGARLIRCLQPDRYAELRISGTAPDAKISSAIMGLGSVKTASLT